MQARQRWFAVVSLVVMAVVVAWWWLNRTAPNVASREGGSQTDAAQALTTSQRGFGMSRGDRASAESDEENENLVPIEGRVEDGHTGVPIEGVTITLIAGAARVESQTKSDRDGAFSFRTPGEASQLRANAPGYAENTVDASTNTQNIIKLFRGVDISGYVVRGTDGSPIPDARVNCRIGHVNDPRVAVTTSTGFFELHNCPAGDLLTVAARHQDYGVALSLLDERISGEVVEGIRIEMRAGARLRGTLVTHDSQKVTGAHVMAIASGGSSPMDWATTDLDGGFELGPVPAGRWEVIGIDADGLGAHATVDLEEGPNPDVQLRLLAPTIVAGKVLTPEGPAEDAIVVLYVAFSSWKYDPGLITRDQGIEAEVRDRVFYMRYGTQFEKKTRTDSEGRFRFERLPPLTRKVTRGPPDAPFSLGVKHHQYGRTTGSARPNQTNVVLRLSGTASIHGVMRRQDGKPTDISGDVTAYPVLGKWEYDDSSPDTWPPRGSASVKNSQFRITGLKPGAYYLAGEFNEPTPERLPVDVKDGVNEVEWVLPAGRTIAGRVIDKSTKKPIASAVVMTWIALPFVGGGGAVMEKLTTSIDGEFKVVHAVDSMKLVFSHPDFQGKTLELDTTQDLNLGDVALLPANP